MNNISIKEISKGNPNKVLICCHGITSNKESNTFKTIYETIDNLVMISFDFRGHGESNDDGTNLNVTNSIEDLYEIYDYALKKYNLPIILVGISFGAYIIVNTVKNKKMNIEKIILRSPAIKMYDALVNKLLDIEQLKNEIKYLDKIKITNDFIDELKKYDIYKDNKISVSTVIFHGDSDELFSKEDMEYFAKKNNFELNILKNVKHGFTSDDKIIFANIVKNILTI